MPSKDHVRNHRWRIATIEGRRLVVKVIRLTSDWPLLAKVACALTVVIGVFLFQFPLEERGFGVPFALFLASAFAISLMFGRLSGFAAAAVSTVLATEFFTPVGTIHLARAFDLFQIECYAALAIGAAITADQIHRALISLSDSNQQLMREDTRKSLQLREVAHRVANNFASLDALIRQRAMVSKDPKIQFAFEQASELVHVVARINNRLTITSSAGTLESDVFVSELCEDLRACTGEHITIRCQAESHELPLTAAIPLGLIINELVTNSIKYAFPDRRSGTIGIAFSRIDDVFRLVVEDNGVGMSGTVQGSGLGLRFLQGFSRAIKGTIDIQSTNQGTSAIVAFEAADPPSPHMHESTSSAVH